MNNNKNIGEIFYRKDNNRYYVILPFIYLGYDADVREIYVGMEWLRYMITKRISL